MVPFERYMYTRIAHALTAIAPTIAADIYALGFDVDVQYPDQPDTRALCLFVSYATSTGWRRQIANASTPEEAQWSYSFWLPEITEWLVVVGNDAALDTHHPDAEGIALREAWLLTQPWALDHSVALTQVDAGSVQGWDKIASAFCMLCSRVA